MVAGLQKLNIAAKQASTTTQTGSSAKSNATKALNSGNLSSGTSFGIFAQRRTQTLGLQYNRKGYYSSATSRLREALNERVMNNVHLTAPQPYNNSSDGMSTMEKIAMWSAISQGVLGLTKAGIEVADGIKSMKTKNQSGKDITNSELPKDNSKATVSSKSVSEMKNAKDSTTLSAAIDKAKAEKATIDEKLYISTKEELTQLKNDTERLKTASDTAQKAYDENLKAINEKSSEVNELTNEVSSYQKAYDALSTDDPKKAEIFSKLEDAKRRLESAQEELKNLQSQTDNLKQAAGDAKDAYDKNLNDIKSKEAELTQLKADSEKLKTEIPSQEKRLKELAQKEEKELEKVNNKISSIQGKINNLEKEVDISDENGYSKGEQKAHSKADRKRAEFEQLKQRQAELQKRKDIKLVSPEIHNGLQFKTGLSGGKQFYVVDGQEVDENTYNSKLQAAKNADTK